MAAVTTPIALPVPSEGEAPPDLKGPLRRCRQLAEGARVNGGNDTREIGMVQRVEGVKILKTGSIPRVALQIPRRYLRISRSEGDQLKPRTAAGVKYW